MTGADAQAHAAAGTLAAAILALPRDDAWAYLLDRAWLGVLALESAPRSPIATPRSSES